MVGKEKALCTNCGVTDNFIHKSQYIYIDENITNECTEEYVYLHVVGVMMTIMAMIIIHYFLPFFKQNCTGSHCSYVLC